MPPGWNRVTNDAFMEQGVDWCVDGRIVYSSNRSGQFDIWIAEEKAEDEEEGDEGDEEGAEAGTEEEAAGDDTSPEGEEEETE